MKPPNPLRSLARFRNKKQIAMRLAGNQVVWMHFDHVRELISYLKDMLEGDLLEVKTMDCGCLKPKRATA